MLLHELSLVVESRLLIAVAPLFAEHRLQGARPSAAVMRRLSCPTACGIFLDKGSTASPALAGRFFTTDPQESLRS